jgi:hypothetical protein
MKGSGLLTGRSNTGRRIIHPQAAARLWVISHLARSDKHPGLQDCPPLITQRPCHLPHPHHLLLQIPTRKSLQPHTPQRLRTEGAIFLQATPT